MLWARSRPSTALKSVAVVLLALSIAQLLYLVLCDLLRPPAIRGHGAGLPIGQSTPLPADAGNWRPALPGVMPILRQEALASVAAPRAITEQVVAAASQTSSRASSAAAAAVATPDPRPVFPPPTDLGRRSEGQLRDALHSTKYPNGVRGRTLAFVVHHHHQPSSAAETVEQLQRSDVAYFIKACKKFEDRARAMYDSWAKSAPTVFFSTDQLLDGIPKEKQIITSLDNDEVKKYLKIAQQWEAVHHAQSCALTVINMGRFLSDELFPTGMKWWMLIDDDTLVMQTNLLEYLSVFPSARSWYLGLSNAEVPSLKGPGGGYLPITATAPGVLLSRGVAERLRRRERGLDLSRRSTALDVCARCMDRDDVAIGCVPLLRLGDVPYVARPDLRGYHFQNMPDPTHLKPLSVHLELQSRPLATGLIVREALSRYNSSVA